MKKEDKIEKQSRQGGGTGRIALCPRSAQKVCGGKQQDDEERVYGSDTGDFSDCPGERVGLYHGTIRLREDDFVKNPGRTACADCGKRLL